MKTRHLFLLSVLMLIIPLQAQHVNTLYFLENAPQRHLINPAFQPISRIYVGITPLSYTSLNIGNNSLTLKDLIYKKDGEYVTALYPGNASKLRKRLKYDLRVTGDLDATLFNFGFRLKEKNYIHVAVTERMQTEEVIPGNIQDVLYSDYIEPDGRVVNLSSMSAITSAYTEASVGYSRKINDKWTVGGKLKFLVGHAYLQAAIDDATVEMHPDRLISSLNGHVYAAAPFTRNLPYIMSSNELRQFSKYIDKDVTSFIKPTGYGAAVDLGVTFKPLSMLNLSLSVTDFGFIRWSNITDYTVNEKSEYEGPVMTYPELFMSEEEHLYRATSEVLTDTVINFLVDFAEQQLKGLMGNQTSFTRMLNGRLHVGIDANFWKNRVTVGLYSCTTFRGKRAYEELTLGASIRPANWFNFALTYSFINGRWNSFGAGLSIMPYDGINLMLTTDYIPTSYAHLTSSNNYDSVLPYNVRRLNLALGLCIVIGTNPKKAKADAKEAESM